MKQGTLVDATVVQAATRPPGKRREAPSREGAGDEADAAEHGARRTPDGEAAWTVKGGRPIYGYKHHLGVDWGSELIRRNQTTPASLHDSRVFEPLLSGDEDAVYADKAYDKASRRRRLRAAGVLDGIMHRGRRGGPLSPWERDWNRYLSTLRSPVERVFGTLKRRYGFARARYRGLARNHNHGCLLAIAYNLRRATSLVAAS